MTEPGFDREVFQLQINEDYASDDFWKEITKPFQLIRVSQIKPVYEIVKIRGHKRVKLTGYSHLAELI